MEENRQRHKKYLSIFGLIAILLMVGFGTALNPGGRAWLAQTWQTLRSNQQSAGSFSELFPPEGTLTTKNLTVDGHTYRLKITADKKQLLPLPGEDISFNVQLVEGNRSFTALPQTLAKNSKAKSPELQVKITGVANIYGNETYQPVSTYRLPGAATHIYSPQATSRYSYPYKKDTLEATLDFSSGNAEVGYVYGGGNTTDKLKFQATAIFYDGETTQGVEIPFMDDKVIATSNKIPDTQYAKGDFYYQVSFEPNKIASKKETYLHVTVKAIDSRTGRLYDNPYQRVRIEVWPLRAFYAFGEARFEETGRFLAAPNIQLTISSDSSLWYIDEKKAEALFAGINTLNPSIRSSIFWHLTEGQNTYVVPSEQRSDVSPTISWVDQQILDFQKNYLDKVYTPAQVQDYIASMSLSDKHVNFAEFDLVNGVGEVYFRYSGNIGAIPYLTFVVSPIDFMKIAGGVIKQCDGTEYRTGMLLPKGNHRQDDPEFCLLPAPRTAGAKALYGDWMTAADFKKLQQQIQTITYLPVDR